MKEKTYTFHKSRMGLNTLPYTKAESELDNKELDLLTGQLIKDLDNYPDIVVKRVVSYYKIENEQV